MYIAIQEELNKMKIYQKWKHKKTNLLKRLDVFVMEK